MNHCSKLFINKDKLLELYLILSMVHLYFGDVKGVKFTSQNINYMFSLVQTIKYMKYNVGGKYMGFNIENKILVN